MKTNRFYPEDMPAFANEPTRDRFDIIPVSEEGVGVGAMTCDEFKAGDVIFSFTGFFSDDITQYTLQVCDGLHLHDPFFMGRVLHSCSPNASCDMQTRTFYALRDIHAGEFITMDYCETEDYLFKTFPCVCGADNCRGVVKGRQQ